MAWIDSWESSDCTRYLQKACSELIKVIAWDFSMSYKKRHFPIPSGILRIAKELHIIQRIKNKIPKKKRYVTKEKKAKYKMKNT